MNFLLHVVIALLLPASFSRSFAEDWLRQVRSILPIAPSKRSLKVLPPRWPLTVLLHARDI